MLEDDADMTVQALPTSPRAVGSGTGERRGVQLNNCAFSGPAFQMGPKFRATWTVGGVIRGQAATGIYGEEAVR